MYIVTLKSGNQTYTIHDSFKNVNSQKLKSGSIVKGINSIDTFSFSVYQNNIGFDNINSYSTLINVYNTKKKRYEFYGRVLIPKTYMEESGLIYKDVTCESYFGFLCDSKQPYVEEKNWTLNELLTFLINSHNEQVEPHKRFKLGNITMKAPNDNIYVGIQRENTWNTIKTKLLDKIGGEIAFRVANDEIYFDYHEKIGTTKVTTIELRKNMKSISKEDDPTKFITRLIPLGSKIKKIVEKEDGTTEEVESEERVGIESVNNGLSYIDDTIALQQYGIIIAYEYWDDVKEPSILLSKAKQSLIDRNKIKQKYSISTVDLSLIGIDIDDLDVHNYYPIKNELIGVNDTLRIIKKNIDIVNFTSSSVEVGDNFKTLTDKQLENDKLLNDRVGTIEKDYVTNQTITNVVEEKIENSSIIKQLPNQIISEVAKTYTTKTEVQEAIDNIELKTLYTWIKYADDESGTNMSSSSAGKAYIGIAYNKETNTPSETPGDYAWTKIQGEDGVSGTDGKDAAIQSATPPTDTSMMWYDTTANQLKRFDGTNWIIVNDWTDDVEHINKNLGDMNNDLSTKIEDVFNGMTTIVNEYKETISTQLSQTSEDWTFNFNKVIEQITNVDGTVNSNYQEIIKYIRMVDGELEIGIVGNDIVLRQRNDRLAFLQNGVEVAYVSNNRLYITVGEFIESVIIGNFAFIPRTNGNLSFKRVKGGS